MRGFLLFTVLLTAGAVGGCGTDKFSSGDDSGGTTMVEGGTPGDAAGDASVDLRSLGTLALWLNASQGVMESNGAVVRWIDQSGNNNDAHVVAGVPSPKRDSNGANGRPCLHFEANAAGDPGKGNLLAIDDKPGFQIAMQQFHITVVARWNNDPGAPAQSIARGALLYKRSPNNGPGLILLANNPTQMTPTGGVAALVGTSLFGSGATMLNDDKFRSITLLRNASGPQLYVNGKGEGNIGGNMDVGAAGVSALIGASGDTAGLDRLNGDIAEILVFVNQLPPMNVIEAYVKAKYAL